MFSFHGIHYLSQNLTPAAFHTAREANEVMQPRLAYRSFIIEYPITSYKRDFATAPPRTWVSVYFP